MPKPLFTRKIFTIPGAHKAALLITGYRGHIATYQHCINTLNKRGFTVIAYEHSPRILESGNPDDLLRLIDEIYQDTLAHTEAYSKVLCTGVSIGANICLTLQQRSPERFRLGVYAGAGVSPSETIFEVPFFYFERQAFRRRGYNNVATLRRAWQAREITADAPPPAPARFVMALGRRDIIVRYRKAAAIMHAWQRAGTPITVITKNRGHIGVIRWYKQHFEELLELALENKTAFRVEA